MSDVNEDVYDSGESNSEVWEECFDEATNANYYYNNVTGESRWKKPKALLHAIQSLGGFSSLTSGSEEVSQNDDYESEIDSNRNKSDAEIIAADGVAKLPPGWEIHFDANDGSQYYYNTHTGESSWYPPDQ